jgi:hypothetical protein
MGTDPLAAVNVIAIEYSSDELARQAEPRSSQVQHRLAGRGARGVGASATVELAGFQVTQNEDTSRAADQAPVLCTSLRHSPAPTTTVRPTLPVDKTEETTAASKCRQQPLDSHGRSRRISGHGWRKDHREFRDASG